MIRPKAGKEKTLMSEVYLYDEIVKEKYTDWDGVEHGFSPDDLAEPLRAAGEGETVNIFVNSPGGSVFAAVAMTSEIKRAIQRGVRVNAYVDGIAASAASFLVMACETVSMYSGTMLMVHKPWSICIGNADDFMKAAEDLEEIQEGTCMPLYRSKLKNDEEELKVLMSRESWLSASKAAEFFDITVIDEAKDVSNSISSDVLNKLGYKHVPEQLIKKPENAPAQLPAQADNQPEGTPEPVDYTEWDNRINNITGGRS